MLDEEKLSNPYIGPRPFKNTELDRKRFFGRTRESKEICSLILSHRVVLIYAPSGAGKTSLFNAKIIPTLEKEFNFQVLPVVRVRGIESDYKNPENAYVYNTLLNLDDELKLDIDKDLTNITLKEYLNEVPREFDNIDNEPAHVTLIFDQFEELFEYYPEGWEKQREDFFEQVSDVCKADPKARVVFIIREDYLARLRPYEPRLPDRLEVRFRIELLGLDQTLAAIEKPLSVAKVKREYVGKASSLLANKLMKLLVIDDKGKRVSREGNYVLPVQLQVACRTLWERLEPQVQEVTEKMVEDYDVDQALADYYESALDAVSKKHSVSKRKLRYWFEKKLITPMGTRSTIVMDVIGNSTEGIPNTAVEFLESEKHLVHKSIRRGAPWIELTHDQFVQPILLANQKERKKQNRRRFWSLLTVGLLLLILFFGISFSAIQNAADKETVERVETTIQAVEETVEAQEATSQAQAATAEALERTTQSQQATQMAELADAVEKGSDSYRSIGIAKQASTLSDDFSDLALLLSIGAYQIDNNTTTRSSLLTNLIRQLQIISLNKNNILQGHEDLVTDIAFSPDGSKLVSTSKDNYIVIWDLENWQPDFNLRHSNDVLSVAISPDNKMIASGGVLGIRLFDIETRQQLSFSWTNDFIYGIAFSPDSQRLATASWDALETDVSSISLWNITNDELVFDKKILEGSDAFWDVAFSPDSQFLAAASNSGKITLWDLQSNEIIDILDEHTYGVNKVIFKSDGKLLASASDDGTIILWDLTQGRKIAQLEGHTNWVDGIAFHPNENFLASASRDGTIRIWDIHSSSTIGGPYEIEDAVITKELVYNVSFNSSGEILASAIGESNITIWNVIEILPLDKSEVEDGIFTSSIAHQLGNYDADVISASFSQDNKYMVTATENGVVYVWDNSGQLLDTLVESNESKVIHVWFYNGYILILYDDGVLLRWSWEEKQKEVLNSETLDIEQAAVSQDGAIYATYASNGEINVIDVESNVIEFEKLAQGVRSLAINSNANLLAIGYSNNSVEIINLTTKSVLTTLTGHRDWVEHVSFSSDGSLVVTTSLDGTARIWDLTTDEVKSITHNDGLIYGILTNDNQILMTADINHSIMLWDVSGSQIGSPLMIHNGTITDLNTSPDGNRFLSASRDNRAILWDLSSAAWLNLACQNLERNLNLEEVNLYFDGELVYGETCPNLPVEPGIILEYALKGDADSASDKLTHALEIDPFVKGVLLGQAFSEARDSKLDRAALFIQLLSSVDSTVLMEENLQIARAITLVWEGNFDGAYQAFEIAADYNSDLSPIDLLNNEMIFRSKALFDQGRYADGLNILREIKQRNPKLINDPELYVLSEMLVDLRDPWKREVQVPASSNIMKQISNESPELIDKYLEFFSSVYDELCFWGSLEGYTDDIFWACNQAVILNPENALYRDSRGLAFALSGNYEEAIADYEEFIRFAEYNEQYNKMIPSRESWIENLKEGISPFTEEVLTELKAVRNAQQPFDYMTIEDWIPLP
jgi:WD40 repeat protein/DNA-binding transcriptional MerR regulator